MVMLNPLGRTLFLHVDPLVLFLLLYVDPLRDFGLKRGFLVILHLHQRKIVKSGAC